MIKNIKETSCDAATVELESERSVRKVDVTSKNVAKGKTRRIKKNQKERQLEPLRDAAKRIADMLCEFSGDRELFLADGSSERRLDTKALKEFSLVLKEISSVMSELHGESAENAGGVRIEFSDEALDMSI